MANQNKRTYINADEELIIQGKLIVEGDIEQRQYTNTAVFDVTTFQGETLVVNSNGFAPDGTATTATLAMRQGDQWANATVNGDNEIEFSVGISAPSISGLLEGTAEFADSLSDTVTVSVTSDDFAVTDATFQAAGDTAQLTMNLNVIPGVAGSYGAANSAPVFTVDNKGRISAVSTQFIDITSDQVSNFESAARSTITATGSLSYDSVTGVLTYTERTDNQIRSLFSAHGDLAYDAVTGAFTVTTYKDANARAAISVVNVSGDGSMAYDNNSGVISYTGASASEVRAHFTGGDGIDLDLGDISVDNTVVRTSGVQIVNGTKTFTDVMVPTLDQTDISTAAASTAYVRTAVANLIDNAPAALDTLNELAAAINDDANLGGIVSNNTTRVTTLENTQVIAGNGLTGGGNLTQDRTLGVGAGTGILVDAHTVSVNALWVISQISSSGNINYDPATGVISESLTTTDITEGDNLYYTDSRARVSVDGYLVGGSGINYVAGEISADNTVVRVSGDQTIDGKKDFTGLFTVPNSASSSYAVSTTNGSVYHDGVDYYGVIAGSAVKLTPSNDVGEVESVGDQGIPVYGGARDIPLGNATVLYHGIRHINSGDYTMVSELSNTITVDANVTAIRSLFTVNSSPGLSTLTLNDGVFTHTPVTTADVRAQISVTGDTISYNSSTGEINSTADLYSAWQLRSESGAAAEHSVTAHETVTLQGGTGITVSNSGNVFTITNDNTADITAVSAGNGLTGGGTSGDVTLNIGAGYGIQVDADQISVNAVDAHNILFEPGTLFSANVTNVQSAVDSLQQTKLDISAITTSVAFFPTDAASDVPGYIRMVTDTADADYNAVSVDFDTGDITGSGVLLASIASDTGVLQGNTTPINVTIVGQVRRTSGMFTAGELYFEVYLRDTAGTETLLGTSSNTIEIDESQYEQFTASALITDTNFDITDRVVFKWYANASNGSTFRAQIQIGGDKPVRTLFPVPVNVVPIERTDAEVRALFSGGDGIDYQNGSGEFSVDDTVARVSGTDFTGSVTVNGDVVTGTTYTTTAVSKQLATNEKCLVTVNALTVTLPSSPQTGDQVGVIVENFIDTTVDRNGSTIMELAENLTIDKPYTSIDLVYIANSWRIK